MSPASCDCSRGDKACSSRFCCLFFFFFFSSRRRHTRYIGDWSSDVCSSDLAGDVIGRIRALVAKAAPRNDQLDINEVMLDVIALTRSELRGSGTALQTQLADGLPLILGDRIQLQQVMLNLIFNAVEAMSEAH